MNPYDLDVLRSIAGERVPDLKLDGFEQAVDRLRKQRYVKRSSARKHIEYLATDAGREVLRRNPRGER